MNTSESTTDTELMQRLVKAAEATNRQTYAIQVLLTIALILAVIGGIIAWAYSL